jgi:dihydroxy-acid dehydratase
MTETEQPKRRLRSQDWFDNPDHRHRPVGLRHHPLQPSPSRTGQARDSISDAGGIPIEFPSHPLFEDCKRPTAATSRNPSYRVRTQ